MVGLPHADSHSNDDMEIKPGIAEMIREEERVSLNHFCFILIHVAVDVVAVFVVAATAATAAVAVSGSYVCHL